MKQGKEKKILEELSKETKTKESEEHWINPNYKSTYNIPNKVIIEDKNPSFFETKSTSINIEEVGKKTFGDVKKTKKLFEYEKNLNLPKSKTNRLVNQFEFEASSKKRKNDSKEKKNKKQRK